MSLTNPETVVTEERLSEFYTGILPYLGGMPEIVANKFNKGDLYYTDERLIGKWIDNKPLYQRTFIGDLNATSAQGTEVQTKISIGAPVETVAYCNCFVKSADSGTFQPVYTGTITPSRSLRFFIGTNANPDNQNMISIANAWFTVATTYHATIQYTKTTDSAISIGSDTDYSTTEKIVGTWIDGSKVYQKTISCGALPNNATKEISHGISNLKRIIYYEGYAYSTSVATLGPIPFVQTNANGASIGINSKNGKIVLGTTSDLSMFEESYVTLKYTKTS